MINQTFLNGVVTPPAVLLAENSAASDAFGKLEPTVTEPTGENVITIGGWGWLYGYLFGAGSDNQTFEARMSRWDVDGEGVWHPRFLSTLTGTLSAVNGAANQQPSDSDRLADTLSGSGGDNGLQIEPGVADIAASWFRQDCYGGLGKRGNDQRPKLKIETRVVSATSANLVYAFGN